MSTTLIPDAVLERQREASDPAVSAWVAANAGSGKTFVLAQRVIRLLLGGTDPAKILCLTFTKAAAANMATTVFDTLAKWIALDDDALDAEIHKMSNEQPTAARRALARQLFALALETPGSLKVQTIHAFCTRLLQQFPFEADVAARFSVLEDAAQSQLLEQLTLDVLLEAAANPDAPLGRALATAITVASDIYFREVVREAIAARDAVIGFVDRAGGVDAALAELSRALGISPADSIAGIEAEFFAGSHVPESEWTAIAEVLAQGLKTDVENAERLRRLAALSAEERRDDYLAIFCTDKLERRKTVVTASIRKNHPELYERLCKEQDRICAIVPRWRAVRSRERSAALITVAAAVIRRYQAEKARRGLLDYDDLIDKARELLARFDAAWVHYKLDLGIDHVLIDEAQDTSPKQWEVIERLTAEFAAGAGARGSTRRSIFAVGDDKQSIFSFQGAAPEAFAEKRGSFKRLYNEGGLDFRPLEFKYSFRSVQVVLDAVDAVCSQKVVFNSLSAGDQVPTSHFAVRAQAPGLVEVWSPEEPDKTPPVEGWDAPFDTSSETSPRVRLARKIAAYVGASIARGDPVGDGAQRRPVRPGDILILVRQRGALFEAMIRALKNAGIAVAGADRLILDQHIAVMDLVALADALLLAADDLALATVLKSPLFGLDEEALFALAHERRGSLAAALRAKVLQGGVYEEAQARLDRLAAAARRETPFAFYARVLGPEDGRKRFLARLGPEANDALDEFLNLALDYERRETPSLQGFVAWLRTANAEVKRDMEIRRDEVRVMTVHGAKGLEAPVVILADTTTPPAGPYPPRLLKLATTLPPGAAPPLVWGGRKEDDAPAVATARQAAIAAAEAEYRRLLYVAMTRAADRLIVCGANTLRGKPQGCWYDLVHAALAPLSVEEATDDGGRIWRFHKDTPEEPARPASVADAAGAAADLPGWLVTDARSAPPARVPLAPSRAYDEATSRGAGTVAARKKAIARGTLMHRLLQSLPDLPADTRAAAARRFLARSARDFTADEIDEMAAGVLRLLDDARFAELFAPGKSRAEVAVAGAIVRGTAQLSVTGQLDRLALTADAILIADYKTNRPAPRRLDQVPKAYVTQLALYRAVLAELYPGKPVRAALIFTEIPELIEIPTAALEEALAGLTSA